MSDAAEDDSSPLHGLEERLLAHSHAFESLLALTPARDYYGSQIVDGRDPSEQWNRKKQTKEEKHAAKRAKLDPANQKSALDVMKEREAAALKRKRAEVEEAEDVGGANGVDDEVSAKVNRGDGDADSGEARRRMKAEKRKEKRRKKSEKDAEKKEKAKAKKERKAEKAQRKTEAADSGDIYSNRTDENAAGEMDDEQNKAEEMDFSGFNDTDEQVDDVEDAASGSSAPTTPLLDSPAFDIATNHSATSSSSSIIPPSLLEPLSEPLRTRQTELAIEIPSASAEGTQTPSLPTPPSTDNISTSHPNPAKSHRRTPSGTSSPKLVLPDVDHELLKERLRKRIEEMRQARKADGPDGQPVRTRQELLEQRRKKQDQRKAAIKAQREKEKEDEARRREEQLRGSGSPLNADIFSPRSRSPAPNQNSYAFSRLKFEDGTAADASLTTLQDAKKRKGPQDARTALQAAQAKQSRLAGFDADKRADIADKDMWLNAKKRAHGERVRDDTSLLKKALKRQEGRKARSEQQWNEREQNVIKGREMKQKKREANLQKRKEEKGGKKKGAGKGGKPKKKNRPGFEGRFKA